MKQTFTFISPVVDSTQSPVRTEAYEQSVDLYNQGEYVQAFHSLLDYLNTGFRTKYGNADGTEFHIPHGSILVHIRIADGFFRIDADFLNLPEKGRVAMLRQVADLNLNKLLLPRFVKDGDKLRMEYTCPLSQSHPHKMYFVLQNICHVGDKYDDEFCTKFGAVRCYEPQVIPYPQEEIDRIYEGIQTLGRETLEALKEYSVDRRYGYSWNVLDTTFYQISYFAHPQGQLLNDLDKAVNDMDADLPTEEVVAKGRAFLEKLLAVPKEKLAEDLYFVDMLVSTKHRSSLKNMQENFANVYKEATEAIQSENYERSAVRLLYIFYEAYFYNDVQNDINAIIAKALKKAGNQSVEKASEILYDAMDKIMEGDLDDDDEMDFTAGMEQMQQAIGAMGESVAQAQQKMAETMGSDDIQELQQKMAEAMMSGNMEEYSRLVLEMQKKIMGNFMN
ncbi:hypothetical protein [uncultured Bacteroides sp.]|jgi:hypothetical protein|uniref:hypothetical protein n=1 Tax=uncultured Bacteroides sp. TaxID=162156 RepID=UPI00280C0C9C|nr:hypothetical protein [uncultured Bacteroides sp.]